LVVVGAQFAPESRARKGVMRAAEAEQKLPQAKSRSRVGPPRPVLAFDEGYECRGARNAKLISFLAQ